MTRPRIWHALLLVPLLGVAAWVIGRSGTIRDDPGAVLHALRAAHGPVLPEARAAGATRRSEPAAYDRETLYEFIDGAAEGYLARGFQRCMTANYAYAAQGGAVEIAAEIYRFADPIGAREQMLAEKPTGAPPVAGMAEAYADVSTLVAVSGRDYLKLTALGGGAAAGPALAGLATAWQNEERN